MSIAIVWSQHLVSWTVDIGIVAIVVGMLLCVARLWRGPHIADRAMALDTLGIHTIGLIILFTLRIGSLVLFDGILVLSLLGFAGTLAVAQYVARPHIRAAAADVQKDPDD